MAGQPRQATAKVDHLLSDAVNRGLIPGAVCLWGRLDAAPHLSLKGFRGLTRDRTPVTRDLIYDLASLTKVLATTNMIMLLSQRGHLDTEAPLGAIRELGHWPDRLRELTPGDLLRHRAGLRAWLPFYKLPENGRPARIKAALNLMADQGRVAAPGEITIYSDLGFLLLGFMIETLCGLALETVFTREIAAPLGLTRLGFCPRQGPLAPTEDGFRLGGPLNDPGSAVLGPTPLGRVHDDNAAFFGGRAGQAGLFGPADDLWRIIGAWSASLAGSESLFQSATLRRFLRPQPTQRDSGRPSGFDIRSPQGVLAASRCSPSTVGHLGYTGTSFWWDYERDSAWVLLTNRVHPRARRPEDILRLRQRLAEAIWN